MNPPLEPGGPQGRAKLSVILKISIIILIVEIMVMFILEMIPYKLGMGLEALADAILLVLFSSPFIYVFVVRPYVVANEKALARISYLAYHDALTQLPNRRLFTRHLERCLASCERHGNYSALLLIDLDGFKNINDQYGHDAGDALLIEMSRRLQQITRAEDMASRHGGDEFLLLIQQLANDASAARRKVELVAKKLQQLMSEPFVYKGHNMQINASIGIRILGPENPGVEEAIRDADMSMYQAKKSGAADIFIFEGK